jgi:hypothetical protein
MAKKLVHQIPVRRMNFHNLKTCFDRSFSSRLEIGDYF